MESRIIRTKLERLIKTFTDDESKALSGKYDLSKLKPSNIHLGSYEREEIIRTLLSYSAQCGNEVVGADFEEFKKQIPGDDAYHIMEGSRGNLTDLVVQGYLRLSMESFNIVALYPTEHLLEKIGVAKRAGS